MIVVAHRGSNKKAPENTFDAFDLCIKEGATRIELDIRLTKDCVPVIFHDNSLKKYFGLKNKISQTSFEELKKIGALHQYDVLTLDDVLMRYIEKVELNLEIKPASSIAGKVTYESISKNVKKEHIEKIIVSSFEIKPLEYFKAHAPEIKLACLWCRPRIFAISYKSFMNKIETKIFHPYVKIVTNSMMSYCQSKGYDVIPYCGIDDENENREKLWQKLFELNIDGLCTNYPLELKNWLEEKKRG